MSFVRALIFLAAALAASPLAAQTALAPPPGDDVLSLRTGDRVRIWSADAAPLSAAVGTVNAADGQGLALVIDRRIRVVPFTTLTKLEVRRARRHTGFGALVGAMMGAFASLFLEEIFDRNLDAWEWAAGVSAFTGAGAGLGAAVGHYVRTHRWDPLAIVPASRPPAPVGPPSPRRRPGLSFSFRF
jgi:hypothetical protein